MQTPRRGKEHLARLGCRGVSPWSGEERRCVSELVKRVLRLRAGGEQQRHSHHENRSNLPSRTEGHSGAMASVVSERDYESLVMMRMRQAAERQQLIQQLQREDEEEKSYT
ncbi:hypothetical protein TURU_072299 [Turdus rufiventris]|nr:hypothetical protein TURU_072299 [Turdus rufiventris]